MQYDSQNGSDLLLKDGRGSTRELLRITLFPGDSDGDSLVDVFDLGVAAKTSLL